MQRQCFSTKTNYCDYRSVLVTTNLQDGPKTFLTFVTPVYCVTPVQRIAKLATYEASDICQTTNQTFLTAETHFYVIIYKSYKHLIRFAFGPPYTTARQMLTPTIWAFETEGRCKWKYGNSVLFVSSYLGILTSSTQQCHLVDACNKTKIPFSLSKTVPVH